MALQNSRVLVRTITPAARYFMRRGIAASRRPFDNAFALRHHEQPGMKRYGWTHYGVMIPSLPDPHRYLGLMVMAGETGLKAFDVPGEENPEFPSDSVTVAASTAADGAAGRAVLSAQADCRFSDDHAQFGSIAEIRGRFPHFEVTVSAGNVTAELKMECRAEATWFVASPLYDHVGFMASYRGTITGPSGGSFVEGVGNLEYARCASPAALLGRSLPRTLPIDGFSYHVIDLPGNRQVLFAELRGAGMEIEGLMVLRSLDTPARDTAALGATYRVIEFETEPARDLSGGTQLLPKSFELNCIELNVAVTGSYDCPQRFGVGNGYISSYRAQVRMAGDSIETRGYAEYVRTT